VNRELHPRLAVIPGTSVALQMLPAIHMGARQLGGAYQLNREDTSTDTQRHITAGADRAVSVGDTSQAKAARNSREVPPFTQSATID
jgi:hypothetical protein